MYPQEDIVLGICWIFKGILQHFKKCAYLARVRQDRTCLLSSPIMTPMLSYTSHFVQQQHLEIGNDKLWLTEPKVHGEDMGQAMLVHVVHTTSCSTTSERQGVILIYIWGVLSHIVEPSEDFHSASCTGTKHRHWTYVVCCRTVSWQYISYYNVKIVFLHSLPQSKPKASEIKKGFKQRDI